MLRRQALRSEAAGLLGMAAETEAQLRFGPAGGERPGGDAAAARELTELRDMAQAEAAELLEQV